MWRRKGLYGNEGGGMTQGVKEGPREGMKGQGRTGRGQGEGMGQEGKAKTIGGGIDMEEVLHAVFRYRANSVPWAVKG